MNAEQIQFLNRLKKLKKREIRKMLENNTRKQLAELTGIPYHIIRMRIKELLLAIIILGISSALYSFYLVNWNSTGKAQELVRGNGAKTSSLMIASNNTLMAK